MDALSLLAGQRASAEDVRAGEVMAVVEGVLEISKTSPIWPILKDAGVSSPDGTVIVRRTIGADGRSRAYVNESPWTVNGLAQLATGWIDVSSQHGQQRLLDESTHVELLDQFGGHGAAREDYRAAFAAVLAVDQNLERLQRDKEEGAKQRDFLEFQVKELTAAQLKTGEQEELETLHRRLAHAEKLMRAATSVEGWIDGDEGILSRMGQAATTLRDCARLDPTLEPLAEELALLESRIRDVSAQVSKYGRRLGFEPEEIERINERLALLQRLARKYGSIEIAIAERERAVQRLGAVENFELAESNLLRDRKENIEALIQAASKLTAVRKKTARQFSEQVTRELRQLGMPSAELAARIIEPNTGGSVVKEGDKFFSSEGTESIRFELAPNRGEGFRPLSKIVSGGELSRVLLAIKGIALQEQKTADITFVFDEVDTGIGGETAERVGIQLHRLAQGRQVFCVTHLAQIACYADAHLRVEKKMHTGRTVGNVKFLAKEHREDELARMIGGIEITPKTRDYAGELLRRGTSPNHDRPILTR